MSRRIQLATVSPRAAKVALATLLLMVFVSIMAPWLAPYPPNDINLQTKFMPPSLNHFFGTDDLGRDLFSRSLYAGRISFTVGLIAVGISLVVGVFIGMLAGVMRGWVDIVAMRFVDLMLSFPTFFLILAVIAFLSPSIINIVVVIGLTSWMGIARLVRAEFLRLHHCDFVQVARVVGCTKSRLAWKHMLPSAWPPILVSATLGIASAILVESGLSFLGLGVQPPTASWGNMLIAGKDTLEFAWWISLFPGILILLTVLCFNLVGQWLQDVLNPKERHASIR